MDLTVEQIARVCHETNRAWCEVNGDFSQMTWDNAEDWQRQSAVDHYAHRCKLEAKWRRKGYAVRFSRAS
jgi:hypothetical protein